MAEKNTPLINELLSSVVNTQTGAVEAKFLLAQLSKCASHSKPILASLDNLVVEEKVEEIVKNITNTLCFLQQ